MQVMFEDLLDQIRVAIPPGVRVYGRYRGDASVAVYSECGTYRYALIRIWDLSKPLWLFAMLNPSRASHDEGDATVDRQVTRVKDHLGGGGLIVVNAGGVIETNRQKAVRHPDPIGLDNEAWVRALADITQNIIVAYGPDARRFGGDRLIARALRDREVKALHVTDKGHPGHPLYVAYARRPMPFVLPSPA